MKQFSESDGGKRSEGTNGSVSTDTNTKPGKVLFGNPDCHIIGATVYRRGTIRINRRSFPSDPNRSNPVRGAIVQLSTKSRARMLYVLSATSVEFRSMGTLTYGKEYPRDGYALKVAFHRWKQEFLRRYAGGFFWWLEFNTKRPAPHIHFLSTRANVFGADLRWLGMSWPKANGIGPGRIYQALEGERPRDLYTEMYQVHSHRDAWDTLRHRDGGIKYASSYVWKKDQKEVPEQYANVGRFWGANQFVTSAIQPLDRFSARADGIRALLEAEGHRVSEWDSLPQYIFGVKSLDIGEFFDRERRENDEWD